MALDNASFRRGGLQKGSQTATGSSREHLLRKVAAMAKPGVASCGEVCHIETSF